MTFLIFQFVAIAMMARSEMNYAVTDDLSYAIGTVNEDNKFDQIAISHPFYIQYPFNFCMWARSLWCVYLPYYIFKSSRYNLHKILLKYSKENKIGVMAVSHDKELLEVICDDVLFFNEINQI